MAFRVPWTKGVRTGRMRALASWGARQLADLAELLLNLDGLTNEDAVAKVREEFARLYLAGPLKAHDGDPIIFWTDRFEHAFFTTHDRVSSLYAKTMFCRERGTRVRWIGELIRCAVPNVECWQIKPEDASHTHKRRRLYLIWELGYVVWLEPRKGTGWKFSSAYVTHKKDIARYTRQGFKIWPAQTRNTGTNKNNDPLKS